MPESTFSKVEARPVLMRSARGPSMSPAGQAILLPFLSELSKVDARNIAAREEDRQKAERAEPDGSAAAAAVASGRQDNIEQRQALFELREQAAAQRSSQQQALAERAEKPEDGASSKNRSGSRSGANRAEQSPNAERPQTAAPREPDESGRSSRFAASAQSKQTSESPSVTAKAAGNADAGRSAPQSGVAVTTASSQATETAGKALQSARATAAESVRPATATSPAEGRSPAAKAAPEAGATSSARRESIAAKTSSARSAPPGGSEDGKNDVNVKQILRVIRSRIGQDHSHVTMRLDPPSLGSIRITMDLQRGALELRIEAESPLAQRLLSGKIDALRDALESSGISLERLEIRLQSTSPDTQELVRDDNGDPQQADDESTQANAERPPNQRESESPSSLSTVDGSLEDEAEQTTESLLNVLA